MRVIGVAESCRGDAGGTTGGTGSKTLECVDTVISEGYEETCIKIDADFTGECVTVSLVCPTIEVDGGVEPPPTPTSQDVSERPELTVFAINGEAPVVGVNEDEEGIIYIKDFDEVHVTIDNYDEANTYSQLNTDTDSFYGDISRIANGITWEVGHNLDGFEKKVWIRSTEPNKLLSEEGSTSVKTMEKSGRAGLPSNLTINGSERVQIPIRGYDPLNTYAVSIDLGSAILNTTTGIIEVLIYVGEDTTALLSCVMTEPLKYQGDPVRTALEVLNTCRTSFAGWQMRAQVPAQSILKNQAIYSTNGNFFGYISLTAIGTITCIFGGAMRKDSLNASYGLTLPTGGADHVLFAQHLTSVLPAEGSFGQLKYTSPSVGIIYNPETGLEEKQLAPLIAGLNSLSGLNYQLLNSGMFETAGGLSLDTYHVDLSVATTYFTCSNHEADTILRIYHEGTNILIAIADFTDNDYLYNYSTSSFSLVGVTNSLHVEYYDQAEITFYANGDFLIKHNKPAGAPTSFKIVRQIKGFLPSDPITITMS